MGKTVTAAGKRAPRLRESGRQRRLEILEAALRVMRREGLRAVSHRAVAREARVPLAATTYYFTDLEELVTDAFLHWSAGGRATVTALLERALAEVGSARAASRDRRALADALAELVAAYINDQVIVHRADRVLEFAFLHEALRLPRLRTVVRRQQEELLGLLARFHDALGSAEPLADARISHSVLLGLEKGALLDPASTGDAKTVRAVLARYLRGLMTESG